jgi:FkbM family methyltransferase
MKKFNLIEGAIRRNYYLYIFLRKLAPFICRFVPLEDGFNFLKNVQPLNQNFVALDVGANDGTSIRMIHKYHPGTLIESFDPITKPKFKLKNVNFHLLGLSNQDQDLELFSPLIKGKLFSQYSSLYKEKIIYQITSDMKLSESEVKLQKNLITLKKLDNFDFQPFFIKIDVEGAELKVLEGSESIIRKNLPVLLIEIQNNEIYEKISNYLGKMNYFCVDPNSYFSSDRSRRTLNKNLDGFDLSTNNYIWVSAGISPTWTVNK